MALEETDQRKLARKADTAVIAVLFECLVDLAKQMVVLCVKGNLHDFSVTIAALRNEAQSTPDGSGLWSLATNGRRVVL
jgi:hypothetical protein